MYSPYDDQNKNNLPESAPEAGQEKSTSSPAAPGYGTGSYPYTTQTGGHSYYTQPPQQAQPAQYTWGTAQQPGGFYQNGAQQPPKPRKEKKRGGKFGLKLLVAVLCCAVVSLGSVGVFASLIQNGVVAVQSPEGAQSTAAFTLYKLEDGGKSTTPTATVGEMTSQEVAQKLIPSVVCVQNYQISQQSIMFGGIEYAPADNGEVSPAGEGSGIIFSKDGYIVTNQHVIDGATKIKVVTHDGMSYEAELIGEDTQTDLAVLKIEADQELTPAEFGSSEDLQVTDTVMAIGNPGGIQFNSSVTMGYVSALNRQITNGDTGFTLNCIQTDAAINPGNSGGALVDMKGHVVGINSSKIVATGYEGLGFAIPSDTVQPIVSDLIEYGYVKDRAAIGILPEYINQITAMWNGLTPGCYVREVLSENAQKAGLQRGDVITAIDDTQITSSTTVSAFLATKKPGETVTLTVDRASTGESGLEIELVLSENSGVSAKRQDS